MTITIKTNMIKYIALIALMTGCATKPPVKHPAKPFEKPVIRQVNYNYACPVSSMDEFHKNLHKSASFSH